MIVVVHEAAQAEIENSIELYSKISELLGNDFRDEVERAVQLICERPQAWRPLSDRLRRYSLNRFPYGVVYRSHNGIVEIYAVMHLRRRPGYWRERLKR